MLFEISVYCIDLVKSTAKENGFSRSPTLFYCCLLIKPIPARWHANQIGIVLTRSFPFPLSTSQISGRFCKSIPRYIYIYMYFFLCSPLRTGYRIRVFTVSETTNLTLVCRPSWKKQTNNQTVSTQVLELFKTTGRQNGYCVRWKRFALPSCHILYKTQNSASYRIVYFDDFMLF